MFRGVAGRGQGTQRQAPEVDLVAVNGDPSDAEIRSWLKGNICRCTGYQNIVKAIRAGAAALRSA